MACNDWLNIESENESTLTGYFKNENEVERWMYSIFDNERHDASLMRNLMYFSGLICSDAGYYENYRRLDPVFCLDSRNMSSWQGYYNTIYLADVLIENRHRFQNMSEERADFWVAQAYFAKAYAYYELVRRWGEVPIPKGSESMDAEPKQPIETVLAEAIRCAEAALNLPVYEALRDSYGAAVTSKQYASIGTVHTLLAHIYAWMGGLYGEEEYWKKAEAEASEVIDGRAGGYALEPSIDLMLKNCQGGVRNSKETIFDMELNDKDEDYTIATSFKIYYPGMQLIHYPYLTGNVQTIETDAQQPKITVERVKEVYSDPSDVRLKKYWYRLGEVKYLAPNGVDSITSDYAFLDKWHETIWQTNPGLADEYTGVIIMDGNQVIWRLADLILLRAECRARLGSVNEAKADLELIRERAYPDKEYRGSMSREELRKEIFRERERELFGEGHRYFDIVRNGYFREELEGNYKTLTDQDVKNGALYLPVLMGSADNKNVYMKQNTYWLWQQ